MEGQHSQFAACAQFDNELQDYMEGEPRPFIASHAQDCAACRALLADLQSICQAARELALEELPHLAWANLRASLTAAGAFQPVDCQQFESELMGYLESEPHPFVTTHAQNCQPCGTVLADLQSIRQAARGLPMEEPPHLSWASLRTSLAAEGAFQVAACSQFDAELAGYLEGESHPFIATHAQDCPACGALLADLQSIRQMAGDLPLAEPPENLWAKVRSELAEAGAFGPAAEVEPPAGVVHGVEQLVAGWRQIFSWQMLPHLAPVGVLAGLVFLASVLTLPSTILRHGNNSNEEADSFATSQIASPIPAGEEKALARVVSELEVNFKANEPSMTPDLKATYDKSLVSLDGSIRECLDSLQHEPSNALAQDFLLTAYTRKAELLSSALEFQGR